jgi:hypothetical protein
LSSTPGLPVVAGPAEATALGNVLVQARALGAAPATLPGMRAMLRSCLALRTFSPASGSATAVPPGPGRALRDGWFDTFQSQTGDCVSNDTRSW